MLSKNRTILMVVLVVVGLILTACGGGADQPAAGGATAASGDTSGGVTIRYGLWDSNQQPPYQACADAFHKQNPTITVKLEQFGWDDYWSGLQTGMIGGTAPDVFTDHLAKFPEFASKNQLVDLQPLIDKDKVDTTQYIKGLADLWVRDGKRYGLPKDWDTVSIAYNGDMLKTAGVDPATLKDLTWNAQDGGTFGQMIAKLTLDSNGKNGLDPAFDKTKVVQYGYIPNGSGSPYGQEQWSWLASSEGFKFTDGPWATKLYYDDPKVAAALQWYADLNLVKGFAPPYADYKTLGGDTLFQSGKGALIAMGSWKINDYLTKSKSSVGFAPLPKGSAGRKTMFNGLADSIWVGSKNQDAAWQWVKFAASPACENIVGQSAVVFPAIKSGVDAALAARKEKGVDVTSFTDEALDPNGTFLFPITDHASEIAAIMSPELDSIMLGDKKAADALKGASDQINALFQ
jgi:multiple sugar transport system substrate-binding protein